MIWQILISKNALMMRKTPFHFVYTSAVISILCRFFVYLPKNSEKPYQGDSNFKFKKDSPLSRGWFTFGIAIFFFSSFSSFLLIRLNRTYNEQISEYASWFGIDHYKRQQVVVCCDCFHSDRLEHVVRVLTSSRVYLVSLRRLQVKEKFLLKQYIHSYVWFCDR